MPDKFFISYSRVDTPFVLKLANDLKSAGVNIWLDQLNIPPGAHWDNEIEAALNSATCVLAIISPQSMESKNAMDEISFALEQNKKVIPVLLTNTETSFRLRRLQRIDFTGEYEKGVNQLLKAIRITDNKISKDQNDPPEHIDNKNIFPDGFVFDNKQSVTGDSFSLKRPTSYAKMAGHSDEIVTPQRLTTADFKNIIQDHLSLEKQTLSPQKAGSTNKTLLYGIIIFATVAATAGVTWGIFKSDNQQADIKIQDEIHPVPIITTSTDSTHNPNRIRQNVEPAEEKKQTPEVIQPAPVIVVPVVKNKPADIKTAIAEKSVTENKEGSKREEQEQTSAPDSTVKQPVATPVKQPETTPQPVLPKEIFINSDILFEVVFERLPNMKFKREYQPVTFVVTNPVVYNGVTLINKGAIAEGTISLGSIHSTMQMKHVRGAGGQIIALKIKDAGVPMKKIRMNEPYQVTIKKGIKLFF